VSGRDRPDATAALLARVTEIWAGLADADPERMAANTRSWYAPRTEGGGEFRLPVWGREALVEFPGFAVTWSDDASPVDPFTAALLAYYFETSDGTTETGRCIAFSELRDGTFYAQAFQGYTGHELAKVFGNDADGFAAAAEGLGGLSAALADRAFSFRVLPLVTVAAACWLGDEDFGPSYRILFDAAVGHHLPTDVCAIVGSALTRRLIAAARAPG
jgi:hypothetical protein